MPNFYTDVIRKDPRFNLSTRVADPTLLEPTTRAAVSGIVADAMAQGIQLMIFETYRSQVRQELLFKQGASKLQHVGDHHWGVAADLVVVVDNEPTWKFDYSFLGPLAIKHGLVWGGDWAEPKIKHSFVDSDHVQRILVSDQNKLFSGTWYPDDNYSPY